MSNPVSISDGSSVEMSKVSIPKPSLVIIMRILKWIGIAALVALGIAAIGFVGWLLYCVAFLWLPSGILGKFGLHPDFKDQDRMYFMGGLMTAALCLFAFGFLCEFIRVKLQRRRVAMHEYGVSQYREGYNVGMIARDSQVYRAFIHVYRPKMTLPQIPEGYTRLFYISVKTNNYGVVETDDRMIHFTDVPSVPTHLLGAPRYDFVQSGDGHDRLAIMGLVYTLDTAPTRW